MQRNKKPITAMTIPAFAPPGRPLEALDADVDSGVGVGVLGLFDGVLLGVLLVVLLWSLRMGFLFAPPLASVALRIKVP